jgi:hypothetical protein
MAYAPRCEADRFAMRNDSFLRRNGLNDLETAMRNRSFRYVANPFAFLLLRLVGTRCAAVASARLALLHRVQIAAGQEVGGCKKLRKRAGKWLKRLSRVNLCAARPTFRRPRSLPRRLTNLRQSKRAIPDPRLKPSLLPNQARLRSNFGDVFSKITRSAAGRRPCRQSSRVPARVLISWHNILKNIA